MEKALRLYGTMSYSVVLLAHKRAGFRHKARKWIKWKASRTSLKLQHVDCRTEPTNERTDSEMCALHHMVTLNLCARDAAGCVSCKNSHKNQSCVYVNHFLVHFIQM